MASADTEIFVLELVRPDGTPFVTSTWPADEIDVVARRHGARRGTVSHWKRVVLPSHEPASWTHPRDGWVLKSRTPL